MVELNNYGNASRMVKFLVYIPQELKDVVLQVNLKIQKPGKW